MKNTVVDFKMQDGTTLKMTLNYARLYVLRGEDEETYREYNRIMGKGVKEEIENAHILYTAYLCANVESIKDCIPRMEFFEKMPEDREYVNEAIRKLICPKKKTGLQKHSRKKREVPKIQ